MQNRALLDLVARQDGLLSHAQARDHGISESTVQRRVRAGEWDRLLPRTYLLGGHPLTDTAKIRAAGLWAGSTATISGPAAAWWHGMRTQPPDQVGVTVPRNRAMSSRTGIGVRRRDLDPADRMLCRGLWLTGKAITALETAILVPDGSMFLDRALQKHVRFPRVYRAYCRNLGARGAADIARLLTAAADRADSAAERLMIALLRGSAMTGWQHGLPFGPWTIDFAFPAARVAVEVDGWAWHMDVDRFRADRHKGNALVRARWDLLRFTWHDLDGRPDYVVGEVNAALLATARTA